MKRVCSHGRFDTDVTADFTGTERDQPDRALDMHRRDPLVIHPPVDVGIATFGSHLNAPHERIAARLVGFRRSHPHQQPPLQ